MNSEFPIQFKRDSNEIDFMNPPKDLVCLHTLCGCSRVMRHPDPMESFLEIPYHYRGKKNVFIGKRIFLHLGSFFKMVTPSGELISIPVFNEIHEKETQAKPKEVGV